jgi:anti-anti-sigma regulatory factor
VSVCKPHTDTDVVPAAGGGPTGASIELRHLEAHGGVLFTVAGAIGRNDAALLSARLHAELDARPAVVVINLSQVTSCDQAGIDVLTVARQRARIDGVGLHLVDVAGTTADRSLAGIGPA